MAWSFLGHTKSEEVSNDVNTLNGELVKVGENNQYKTTYNKYNLSINPIGFIVGNYYLSGSMAVHPNIAIKAALGFIYEPYGVDVKGYAIGFTVPFYFKKMYTGFYLEPGIEFYFIEDLDGSADATSFGPLMKLGYHWMWDSGLNIALAFGVQRNFVSNDKNDDALFEDFNKFRPTGYFRAGWSF